MRFSAKIVVGPLRRGRAYLDDPRTPLPLGGDISIPEAVVIEKLPSFFELPPAVIDLSLLDGGNGFRVSGANSGDRLGRAVAAAGDFNGDGRADFMVGAPDALTNGASYVVFGTPLGFGATFDPSTLDGQNGFRLDGADIFDRAGSSVASAGDVNDDGFDDIIVGAPSADTGDIGGAGASYVIFGKSGGFDAAVNLGALDGSTGFRVRGRDSYGASGGSVASGGDVNGDGFDDVIIGAQNAGTGGEAYVVFGKSSQFAASISVGQLDGTNGFRIEAAQENSSLGGSVSFAGDINGDGLADIVVGARFVMSDYGYQSVGQAYVIFGKASPFARTLGVASLDGTNGFLIEGLEGGDQLGFSVGGVGDVNGDGIDDLILGAPEVNEPNRGGECFVVFGRSTGFEASFDLETLDGSNGFRIGGFAERDNAGWAVSGAGDFNGDGFDDLIVGAPGVDRDGNNYVGAAYVIFGQATGFTPVFDASAIDGQSAVRLAGINGYDEAAISVSAAGDVNGDGFDDVIVGASGGDPDGNLDAGEGYVVFGYATGGRAISGSSGADSLAGSDFDGDTLLGMGGADTLAGEDGGDSLNGGAGSDWADYSNASAKVRADLKAPGSNTGDAAGDSYVSIENLRGSAFNDVLRGDDFANRIEGLAKADALSGRDGRDTLAGGAGSDTLTGGEGNDRFELASLDAGDADKILDFTSGEDRIALDGDVFGLARVKPSAFVVGTAAGDANDRLIYDSAKGKLYFDADGTGAQAKVLIATLTGAPALDAGDFAVI